MTVSGLKEVSDSELDLKNSLSGGFDEEDEGEDDVGDDGNCLMLSE